MSKAEAKQEPKPIWLTVTNAQGEVIQRINIAEHDLSKALASADLMEDIKEAKRRAELTQHSPWAS